MLFTTTNRTRTLLLSLLVLGCAPSAEGAPKDETSLDDEIVYGGAEDSATRPTRLGDIASGETLEASFGGNRRNLSWTFDAAEGQVIHLNADGVSSRWLDPVLTLYRATAAGNPTGRAIAVNDDCETASGLDSCLELAAPSAGRFVAVVRRYDRGNVGTVSLTLELESTAIVCGGRGGNVCPEGTFCAYEASAICGRADASGTCARRPEACITLYRPVCGCDGHTYSNSCAAASAGVSVDHDGECAPASCEVTGCESGSFCSFCWGSYQCIPDGAAC